jgi:hypothetical protein
MEKRIANMPGPGGSLGMCGVCGNTFLTEIILNQMVQTVGIDGLTHDICVHDRCMQSLKDAGPDWHKLPDGPLRELFKKANDAKDSSTTAV